MRTLIITDVHANLTALEAILAAPAARNCDQIISLGDQVNFGPQPREVYQRLHSLGAVMLLGNHEARLLRVNEPEFAGYNWALQRWTHAQLEGCSLSLPTDLRRGSLLFTHGTPGDPFHLIQADEVPAQLDALPDGITHLFSGHNHAPWHVKHHGRIACNPGSSGMLEDGIGGQAPFVVLEEADGAVSITRHTVPYDLQALRRAFVTAGCSDAAPEMCRIVLHTMLSGEYQATLKMIRRIAHIAETHSLTLADKAAWDLSDQQLPWVESLSTAVYWKKLKEECL